MYFWNSVLKPTKPTIVYSENRVLCSVNLSKQGYPNSFPALKKLLTSHPEFPSTSRHENSSLILWRFFLHFYFWANCTKTEISVDYSVISWTIAFSSLSLKFRFMHFWGFEILIFWQKKVLFELYLQSRCLKITEKVSFNNASEASAVYI